MKLKMVQTIAQVFLPEAGGSQGHYLHTKTYDLALEGAWIRVSSRGKNRISYLVPISNVASMEPLEEAPAPVVPIKKVASG